MHLLHPRFKDSWIEDDVQKKEVMSLSQVHVTSRLGQCEKDSSSTSTSCQMMKTKSLPKSLGYLALSQLVQKRKPSNSVREVERYFEEEIMYFDDDPLMNCKKRAEELPTPAALAKEYLGPTATSAPSERLF